MIPKRYDIRRDEEHPNDFTMVFPAFYNKMGESRAPFFITICAASGSGGMEVNMIFREALTQEINFIFSEGYKEWSKNRTFEQYCTDNAKEDVYGTRYVLDVNNEIVSSLIILKLKDIAEKKAYGIGSVLTPKIHAGKGYATVLLKSCMPKGKEDSFVFLYSDINPEFYKRFNFKILPSKFQRYEKSVCMVYCDDLSWNEFLNCSIDSIPNYF